MIVCGRQRRERIDAISYAKRKARAADPVQVQDEGYDADRGLAEASSDAAGSVLNQSSHAG